MSCANDCDELKHKCRHPWEWVQMPFGSRGYFCTICRADLVFCWVCAAAGLYNMHPEPECMNGHMKMVYPHANRGSSHVSA